MTIELDIARASNTCVSVADFACSMIYLRKSFSVWNRFTHHQANSRTPTLSKYL